MVMSVGVKDTDRTSAAVRGADAGVGWGAYPPPVEIVPGRGTLARSRPVCGDGIKISPAEFGRRGMAAMLVQTPILMLATH